MPQPLHAPQHDQTWSFLDHNRDEPWDIIIVGGGITGAGIALACTQQGYNTLLLEQNDYASGTSSRTSKMVHGGFRYFAQGDIKLTLQSAKEKEALIKQAPSLIKRTHFNFLPRKGKFPSASLALPLLKLYDNFADRKSCKKCSSEELQHKFPYLQDPKIDGGISYEDAIVDDSRLVLRILAEARSMGLVSLNYVKVGLLNTTAKKTTGVTATNIVCGSTISLNAKMVINATGVWADRLPKQKSVKIHPVRGSHIIVSHARLPLSEAISVVHHSDGRIVFLTPWEGATLIGTTELAHSNKMEEMPSISASELMYLLALTNRLFPKISLITDDVISSFSGVRPLSSKASLLSSNRKKRNHIIWQSHGLLSVTGGKLTTFRVIAQDTIKLINKTLGKKSKKAFKTVFTPPACSAEELIPNNISLASRLIGQYGDDAITIVGEAREGELKTIATTPYTWAEVRWAIRHDSVIKLEDLMLRRTHLGNLLPQGGRKYLREIGQIVVQERGWTNLEWKQEAKGYLQHWAEKYGIPDQLDDINKQ